MIRIVTDSAADLPAEIATLHGVEVVPMTIRFGRQEYVDGVDMGPAAFWSKLTTASALPETLPPSAADFLDAFERLVVDGATGIVVVTISSAVSATYQNALLAAEKIADRCAVRVIDSQTASMAQGLQVTAAAAVAAGGAPLDEVALTAGQTAAKTNVLAALDTLDFLARGGRVGRASARFADLLRIKPIVQFVDGAVASAGRVRSRERALEALVGRVVELADRIDALAIVHGDAPDVERLIDAIHGVLPGQNPIIAELGPVVGTHTGPGTIGIAYRLI